VPETVLHRLGDWWRRTLDRHHHAVTSQTWDPLVPVENQAPEGGVERARLAERLMLLATLCRASYGGYAAAAQHTTDRSLADWLHGCARQRKALASELRGVVLVLAEGEAISPPWQRWVAQVATDKNSWGDGWMARCMRGEENLMRLYEQVLTGRLPSGIASLLRRQYQQVVQTAESLRQQPQVAT
jgi:uncharacterized protein (TIGR02284 family)